MWVVNITIESKINFRLVVATGQNFAWLTRVYNFIPDEIEAVWMIKEWSNYGYLKHGSAMFFFFFLRVNDVGYGFSWADSGFITNCYY